MPTAISFVSEKGGLMGCSGVGGVVDKWRDIAVAQLPLALRSLVAELKWRKSITVQKYNR